MVLKRVLIIDDETNILTSLKGVLEDEGYVCHTASDGANGIKLAKSVQPDLVLLDIWMPGEDGIQVLERLKRLDQSMQVIMMSGHGTVETAVRTIKLGAFDFLEKPIHFDKLIVLLEHAFRLRALQNENQDLKSRLHHEADLVGASPLIARVRHLIEVTAPSNGWVLIQGENGTGKELIARSLHRNSLRAEERFIAVNCAAIPDELIESELFGHEKGAFTGAHERKIGKFELAHRGTLFLDEVGDMGARMQAKILRALQECRIQRVGGSEAIDLDLRVIAATNRDLRRSIQLGEFREDLFYRLNVIPIQVPPLRERIEDLPLLLQYFFARFSPVKPRRVAERTLKILQSYSWPGNVRELKNWVERACILSESEELDDFTLGELDVPTMVGDDSGDRSWRSARAAFEKQFILRMLNENGGNISRTAQMIGLERSHLHKKIKSYGIEIPGNPTCQN